MEAKERRKMRKKLIVACAPSAQTFHGHFSKIAQKTLGKQSNLGTSQREFLAFFQVIRDILLCFLVSSIWLIICRALNLYILSKLKALTVKFQYVNPKSYHLSEALHEAQRLGLATHAHGSYFS